MKKFLLVLFVSTLSAFAAYAQVSREDVEKSVKVYFRQSESKLDVDYMDNKAALQKFAEEVKMYYNDPSARFGCILSVSRKQFFRRDLAVQLENDFFRRFFAQALDPTEPFYVGGGDAGGYLVRRHAVQNADGELRTHARYRNEV